MNRKFTKEAEIFIHSYVVIIIISKISQPYLYLTAPKNLIINLGLRKEIKERIFSVPSTTLLNFIKIGLLSTISLCRGGK